MGKREATPRDYRRGMIVQFDGSPWEVESVEFWPSGDRLQIRNTEGDHRVKVREIWAHEVQFAGEVAA